MNTQQSASSLLNRYRSILVIILALILGIMILLHLLFRHGYPLEPREFRQQAGQIQLGEPLSQVESRLIGVTSIDRGPDRVKYLMEQIKQPWLSIYIHLDYAIIVTIDEEERVTGVTTADL